jgi:hypothetical protein
MRLGRLASASFLVLAATAPQLSACSSSSTPAGTPDTGPTLAPEDLLSPDPSCAFNECNAACEPQGYQCVAMGDWGAIPHASACGSWDGKSFPAPSTGKCTASLPTGDAAKSTGVDPSDPTSFVLPTGARAKPAGKTSMFADFKGQFPANVVAVAGTDLVVVVDGGIGEQSVRLVDTTLIGGTTSPVLGSQKFPAPTQTNWGAALVPGATASERRLFVSGGAGSILYAFKVDTAAKTLTRTTADDVKIARPADQPAGGGLGSQYYLSAVTATPDGKRLFVGTASQPSLSAPLLVVDVDPTSATNGKVIKSIVLAAQEIFAIAIPPGDLLGQYAYATIWDRGRVDIVDTNTGTIKSVAVGAYPEAVAAIGDRYLAVVNAAGDSISVIDTITPDGSVVLTVPIVEGSAHGWTPNGIAYDATAKRLYVSLGGLNAVAAFAVDLPATGAPTLAPAGMLPSDWWPTAVSLRQDGSLVVVSGKGHGTGPDTTPFGPGEGDITDHMNGSIQLVPTPDATALTAGKATVEAATNVGALAGASKVDCGSAPYDFPIPADNKSGPSTKIKHVIFVVKENKTFDAIFGDQPGVNGDPKLVMVPGKMDEVFGNQRKVARTFTNFDNYYTSAEQSIQGHVWTVNGRTNDYTERTWLVTWGRGTRGAVAQQKTRTVEGGIFHWLQREKVLFDDMGEAVGSVDDDGQTPKNCCEDSMFPGGPIISQDSEDTQKNCYIVARARATCDLKPFTYVLNPNDHTSGLSAGKPSPETYIAIGDEGLGILIDGLSRSPIWQDTLVVVTEDDPQDGGDHVDLHRTPMYMAGPWVKRGYVSKGHYDVSSIHKLIANIFGKAYPNELVARASLPFDAFSATPDYSAYAMAKRTTPLACNSAGTSGAVTAAMSGWDFSEPDNQPGLSRQLWQHFHGGAEPTFRAADDDD